MCGIVGYIGDRNTLEVLLGGLTHLEYRGYDSAGVTFIKNNNIELIKRKGRVEELKAAVTEEGFKIYGDADPDITVGMGHTRWATHGVPSDVNSHPHLSMDKKICVVHNGIIENYSELRKFLSRKGYQFVSDTDTEVAAQLIEYYYEQDDCGDVFKAVCSALKDIIGSYALVVLCSDYPDRLICAKKDNPIVVGIGKNENFVASDVTALIEYTRDVVYLEDNTILVMKKDSIEVYDVHGEPENDKIAERLTA